MSYGWAPPTAPPTPPSEEEPLSRIPGWVMSLAFVLVLGMLATFIYMLVKPTRLHTSAAPPPQQGRSYPAHWDKRIAPYAKIAAKDRGLRFLHPVPVRFLSQQRFAKSLRTEDGDLSKEKRAKLADAEAQLRAAGLVDGDVDLLDATNDFYSGAVVGYYSFKDKRITVRGHRITPAVKETLVHELTHVLQDQHFHVGARMHRLDKQADAPGADTASTVYDALVEGDAMRVQHKYDASLGPRQRRALVASQHAAQAASQRRTASVPRSIVALGEVPYTLGETLVLSVSTNLGNWAVNRMFRHPPTHDSALLDPYRALTHTTATTKVPAPRLGQGEKKEEQGEFGALSLYLMLAERLPFSTALSAADAWGGDSYTAYRRQGTTCMRVDIAGRTPTGSSVVESALQQWRADGSTATATVSRTGDVVRLQTCDPGSATSVGNDDAIDALNLPEERAGLGIGMMRSGLPRGQARCLAGHLVQDYSLAELTAPDFGQDASSQTRIHELAAECQ